MALLIHAEKGNASERDEVEADAYARLYYPLGYVFDTWLEHRDHGLYPQTGGYDDQDWRLMRDWRTLDRRYSDHVSGKADAPVESLNPNSKWITDQPKQNIRDVID